MCTHDFVAVARANLYFFKQICVTVCGGDKRIMRSRSAAISTFERGRQAFTCANSAKFVPFLWNGRAIKEYPHGDRSMHLVCGPTKCIIEIGNPTDWVVSLILTLFLLGDEDFLPESMVGLKTRLTNFKQSIKSIKMFRLVEFFIHNTLLFKLN